MALQEASEIYIVNLLCDAVFCQIHAKRQTLFDKDVRLVRKIRGDFI